MSRLLLLRLFNVTWVMWLFFAAADMWRPGMVTGVIDLRYPLVVLLILGGWLTLHPFSRT